MGLMSGWGTPDYRVFLGARFGQAPLPGATSRPASSAPPPPDSGSDGRRARRGRRTAARSWPGRGTASCPDVDSDGDGLVDRLDGCPKDAEDKDGFQDEDGCPDPDNDGDGLLDVVDRCPASRDRLEPGLPGSRPGRRRDRGPAGQLPGRAGPAENQGCAAKQLGSSPSRRSPSWRASISRPART